MVKWQMKMTAITKPELGSEREKEETASAMATSFPLHTHCKRARTFHKGWESYQQYLRNAVFMAYLLRCIRSVSQRSISVTYRNDFLTQIWEAAHRSRFTDFVLPRHRYTQSAESTTCFSRLSISLLCCALLCSRMVMMMPGKKVSNAEER